jgi:NitT/TauT family transport system ATP-binding protein
MNMTSKIEIRGIAKSFRSVGGDVVRALEKIDLNIEEGEFVSIVGPSGCGKSTLLNIIAGFERPTAGEVIVDGRGVVAPGVDRGVVFQQYALFPWLTVAGNIAFGPESCGLPKNEVRARVDRGVQLVRLDGFEQKFPHELSGGMRQRCALARCIANEPDIMLMDEPLAALDALTREALQDELLRVWAEASRHRKKTVIYITHSIDEAIFLSDRLFVMTARPGRIRSVVRVPFGRPRNGDVRVHPDFHRLHDEVWLMLHPKETKFGQEERR